jgi:hypothetical protein
MNDNIKAGSDIHAGDGGYSEGTQEAYEEFVKARNQSLARSIWPPKIFVAVLFLCDMIHSLFKRKVQK